MTTPIENNTEELREILQTVNALPTAESGGGGSFEIPFIDVNELGILDGSDPSYQENVEISQATFDELATKLQAPLVRLRFLNGGISFEKTFLTGFVDYSEQGEYYATSADLGVTFNFGIFINAKSNKPNVYFGAG